MKCRCTRCERDRFERWARRIGAGDDAGVATVIALDLGTRYRSGGLVSDLRHVLWCLCAGHRAAAWLIVVEMAAREERSMALNEPEPCERGRPWVTGVS